MGPCIVNIFKYNQQDPTEHYTMVFVTVNALRVSGGSSAHHQELKTVYTASGIRRAFSTEKARQIPDAVYAVLGS
jgi:hypothetical protein